MKVLTPGHFFDKRPLEDLPNPSSWYCSLTLLRHWDLCQALVRHFWQWLNEYMSSLRKFKKRHSRTSNLTEDVVLLWENEIVPAQWPVVQVIKTQAGGDGTILIR